MKKKELGFKNLILGGLFLLSILFISANGEAWSKYTGENAKDKKVAKQVYELGKKYGVWAVSENDCIMSVYITETLYRQMLFDKVSGKKIVRSWVRILHKNYDGKGMVCVYYDNVEVIRGSANWKGEIKVKYIE